MRSIKFLFVLVVLLIVSCSKETTTSKLPVQEVQVQLPEVPIYVPEPTAYQASYTKVTDLIHTKLQVSFDWEKQYLYGVANLIMRPYFYPQNSVVLDAKGFDIDYVKLNGQLLKFEYDTLKLKVFLDKEYTRDQTFELEIKYTAKPEELEEGGSAAITSDKGLYFINPLGEEQDKPQQIWTQGETEASSCWFPTIDSPNEKTTQEIYITVKNKYRTISNGLLIYSKENLDGTRTDYWKQDKAHAPYLFMMTIGEFAEIKDTWKGKEVHYFVEKEYEEYARGVFGITPELLTFFSDKLGYEYPWDKYYQVAVRDYVSGAMENTSAAIFLEEIQLTDREQLDQNWDYIIAHELFHHWFGDLVTCESWSNLALNESFANYSEYLWFEYKYGSDRADFHGMKEEEEYLSEAQGKQEPIVRYHYHHREDMFDRHSYNKGGRVLHMLRKYVGDDAFFAALKKYLKDNEFTDVEIHELRLAFEDVTGEDLNWFFNQWFLSPGHPELKVEHYFLNDTIYMNVAQLQDSLYTPIYKLPLDIAIWEGGVKEIHSIVIDKAIQQFKFPVKKEADLVLFDAEQQQLGIIIHKKSIKELVYQYHNAGKFQAREEALERIINTDFATDKFVYNPVLDSTEVFEMYFEALKDPFYDLREKAIKVLSTYNGTDTIRIRNRFVELAEEDEKSSVRAVAISALSKLKNANDYLEIYKEKLQDSSYVVIAAALSAYISTDAEDKSSVIEQYQNEDKYDIVESVAEFFVDSGDTTKLEWFMKKFNDASPRDKIGFSNVIAEYVETLDSTSIDGVVRMAEELALNHEHLYARFSGYKILWNLDSIEGVFEKRKQVIENEENKILINAYERWENKIIRIGE